MVKGKIETDLIARGEAVIGIDEVGRGCLAGPVVAAGVALNYSKLFDLPQKTLDLIRDSKKLSPKQRAKVRPIVTELAIAIGIGQASVGEIEELGILQATFVAMNRALAQLKGNFTILLVDGNRKIPDCPYNQITVVGGDNSCYAIAAASIVAKETRDSYMRQKAKEFPHYGFEKHVGYGTCAHREKITLYGISPLHRRNFAPIKDMVKNSL